MTALNAVLPLLSILLGAGITYWLNVRQRRLTALDDLFARAIATAAVAEASVDFISHVAPWNGATEADYAAVMSEIHKEAVLGHTRAVAEARRALAQVVPFRPDLDRFYRQPPAEFLSHIPQLIAALRDGPPRSHRAGQRRGITAKVSRSTSVLD